MDPATNTGSSEINFAIALATSLSVAVLVFSLYWDYRWRRRQYAIGLLEKWNDCTADHAKAILTEFPWLREQGAQIGRLMSKEIYCCKAGGKYWDVRFHIVELLNHAEAMAVAIDKRIAAKTIIGNSIDSALKAWYGNLKNFLLSVEEISNKQPWQGLIDYIELLDANCKILFKFNRWIKRVLPLPMRCLTSFFRRNTRTPVTVIIDLNQSAKCYCDEKKRN